MIGSLQALPDRLFKIFSSPEFLELKGIAAGVPLFIQPYDAADDDRIRGIVSTVTTRLHHAGVSATEVDLFDLVLAVLEELELLDALIENEAISEKVEFLDELRNLSAPRSHVIPRLMETLRSDDAELTLLTGSGRVFPFLRTHALLEEPELSQLGHPVVLFFPGEYIQEEGGGSHLRLFGKVASPTITNPHYRAMNLDHFCI
jgi:hypothetical protein